MTESTNCETDSSDYDTDITEEDTSTSYTTCESDTTETEDETTEFSTEEYTCETETTETATTEKTTNDSTLSSNSISTSFVNCDSDNILNEDESFEIGSESTSCETNSIEEDSIGFSNCGDEISQFEVPSEVPCETDSEILDSIESDFTSALCDEITSDSDFNIISISTGSSVISPVFESDEFNEDINHSINVNNQKISTEVPLVRCSKSDRNLKFQKNQRKSRCSTASFSSGISQSSLSNLRTGCHS